MAREILHLRKDRVIAELRKGGKYVIKQNIQKAQMKSKDLQIGKEDL